MAFPEASQSRLKDQTLKELLAPIEVVAFGKREVFQRWPN